MTAQAEDSASSLWQRAIRDFAVRGLLLCLTLFLIEVGLFFAVSSLPYFPGEGSYYTTQAHQLNSTVSTSTGPQLFFQIFTNNYRIALIEMIPVLGTVFFVISIYATARVTEAIAGIDGVSALVLVLLLLLIFPHSYLELPAYAVATAEGLYLFYAIIKALGGDSGRLSREGWQLLINFLIVTVMLAVAALFEVVEIELGGFFWITWIPFVLLVAGVLFLNRRLSRVRRQVEGRSAQPSAPVS